MIEKMGWGLELAEMSMAVEQTVEVFLHLRTMNHLCTNYECAEVR